MRRRAEKLDAPPPPLQTNSEEDVQSEMDWAEIVEEKERLEQETALAQNTARET